MAGFVPLLAAAVAVVTVLVVRAGGCCNCGCPVTSPEALYPPQYPVLYYAPQQYHHHLQGHSALGQGIAAGHQEQLQVALVQKEPRVEHAGNRNQDTTQELSSSESSSRALLPVYSQVPSHLQSNNKQSIISQHHPTHYIHVQQLHPEPTNSHNSNSLEEDTKDHEHHHDKNIRYKYEYSVNDLHTHDVKKHMEEREGDVVKGEYSILEGDGNVRTVKYYADWKSGFHAQVHNSKKKAR